MQRPRPPFPSHNGPLAASGRGAEPGWDAGPPSLQVRGSSGYEGRQWVTFVCREQPVFLRSKTKKQNKTVTHFSVIVLEAAPGARALRPETQPVKPWAGTKTRPRGPWHPEGSGRFGVQRTPLRARTGPRLGKAGPACVTTPPPPRLSPQGESAAKLVSAFQPVLVLSSEPPGFAPPREVRRESMCLSRCYYLGRRSVCRVQCRNRSPDISVPDLGVL